MRDVVAAVIRDGGRVLACRRRQGIANAGMWEFPGGKVEPGESPQEALIREIGEELGVPIGVDGPLVTVERPEAGIRLVVMLAHLDAERPRASSDHDALEWLTAPELASRTWSPADRSAVGLLIGANADADRA